MVGVQQSDCPGEALIALFPIRNGDAPHRLIVSAADAFVASDDPKPYGTWRLPLAG